MALHDAVRFGRPEPVIDDLAAAVATTRGAHLLAVMARHGGALLDRSADALGDVAHAFAEFGAWLLAAEAMAQRSAVLSEADPALSARAAAISFAWEARCQSARTPALAARSGELSPRSMEIAGDAARGIPSATIAERRFIATRTVDNHLGTVYRSLDIRGRDELADLLGPYLPDDAEDE